MRNPSALRAFALVASSVALLSGCSLFKDGPGWGSKRDADKQAVEVPALPEPVPTHKFQVDPGTDIVGVVQKTQATKEDTLTDIARRFNVGYEEIVRANPGVDPLTIKPGQQVNVPTVPQPSP